VLHRAIVYPEWHPIRGRQFFGDPPGVNSFLKCIENGHGQCMLPDHAIAERLQRAGKFLLVREHPHLPHNAVEVVIGRRTESHTDFDSRAIRLHTDKGSNDQIRWTFQRSDPGRHPVLETLQPGHDPGCPRYQWMRIPRHSTGTYVGDIRCDVSNATTGSIDDPDCRMVRELGPVRIAGFPTAYDRMQTQGKGDGWRSHVSLNAGIAVTDAHDHAISPACIAAGKDTLVRIVRRPAVPRVHSMKGIDLTGLRREPIQMTECRIRGKAIDGVVMIGWPPYPGTDAENDRTAMPGMTGAPVSNTVTWPPVSLSPGMSIQSVTAMPWVTIATVCQRRRVAY
jgi:hypothetical protein